MYRTPRSIKKEAERVKEALRPSQTFILYMWRPGDPPSDTHHVVIPSDTSQYTKEEAEKIAEGLREHRRVIHLPLRYELGRTIVPLNEEAEK